MAAQKPMISWSSSSDESQDAVMQNRSMRSLMVLFHCPLGVAEREIRDSFDGVSRTVAEALSLKQTEWPDFLFEAVYITSRELAVILSDLQDHM